MNRFRHRPGHVRFSSVRGHRIRLGIAVFGTAAWVGYAWPYVWVS